MPRVTHCFGVTSCERREEGSARTLIRSVCQDPPRRLHPPPESGDWIRGSPGTRPADGVQQAGRMSGVTTHDAAQLVMT